MLHKSNQNLTANIINCKKVKSKQKYKKFIHDKNNPELLKKDINNLFGFEVIKFKV